MCRHRAPREIHEVVAKSTRPGVGEACAQYEVEVVRAKSVAARRTFGAYRGIRSDGGRNAEAKA